MSDKYKFSREKTFNPIHIAMTKNPRVDAYNKYLKLISLKGQPQRKGFFFNKVDVIQEEIARLERLQDAHLLPEPVRQPVEQPVRQSRSEAQSQKLQLWDEAKRVASQQGQTLNQVGLKWTASKDAIKKFIDDSLAILSEKAYEVVFNLKVQIHSFVNREENREADVFDPLGILFKTRGTINHATILKQLGIKTLNKLMHEDYYGGYVVARFFHNGRLLFEVGRTVRGNRLTGYSQLERLITDDMYTYREIGRNEVGGALRWNSLPLANARVPEYHSLSSGNQLKADKCVINALFTHLQGEPGFCKMTYQSLIDEFGTDKPSVDQIHEWLTEKDIGHYLRDPMGNMTYRYASRNNNVKPIYGHIANSHIYTITDRDVITKIQHSATSDTLETLKPNYKKPHKVFLHTLDTVDGVDKLVNCIEKIQADFERGDQTIAFILHVDVSQIRKDIFRSVILTIYTKSNILCENIISGTRITGFTYKSLYVTVDNKTEEVVKAIHRTNPYSLLRPMNQSIGKLASEVCGTYIPYKSQLNDLVTKAFELTPRIQDEILQDVTMYPYARCYDINKCYRACFESRDEPLYFISPTDEFVKFSGGELLPGYYFLDTPREIKLGVFSLAHKVGKRYQLVVRSQIVKYLIENDLIQMTEVKAYLKPSISMHQDTCKKICEHVDKLELKDAGKLLLNSYFGMLGKIKSSSYHSQLSNDRLMTEAMYCAGECDEYFGIEDQLFMMRKESVQVLTQTNRPIFSDIIVDGIIRLYELCKKVMTTGWTLISYKTDCIVVSKCNNIELGSLPGQYKLTEVPVRELPESASDVVPFVSREDVNVFAPEWQNISKYEDDTVDSKISMEFMKSLVENKESFRLQGKGGYGKSTLASKLMNYMKETHNVDCIGLGLSNQVRILLEAEGIPAMTLEKFFAKHVAESQHVLLKKLIKRTEKKYIVIDELSMITRSMLAKIYELWRVAKFPVIILGDYRQLPPVDSGNRYHYRDNFNMAMIKEMCSNNLIELKHAYRCDALIEKISTACHDGKKVDADDDEKTDADDNDDEKTDDGEKTDNDDKKTDDDDNKKINADDDKKNDDDDNQKINADDDDKASIISNTPTDAYQEDQDNNDSHDPPPDGFADYQDNNDSHDPPPDGFGGVGKIAKCPFDTNTSVIRKWNICYTHDKRREINEMCLQHFKPETGVDELGYFKGLPLRAYDNEKPIYNGDKFTYDRYDSEKKMVYMIDKEQVEQSLELAQFHRIIEPAYCVTVHSLQGGKISEDFNIFECSKFSNKMIYTALTRAEKAEHIHIDGWPATGVFRRMRVQYKTTDCTKRLLDNYIYALAYGSGKNQKIFYVGRTTNIEHRLAQHIAKIPTGKQKVYEYLRANALYGDPITIIELANCISQEAEWKEYQAIQIYRAAGHQLQNEYLMPTIEPPRIPYNSTPPIIQLKLLGTIYHKVEDENKGYYEFRIERNGKREVKKIRYSSRKPREVVEKEIYEYQRNYSTM